MKTYVGVHGAVWQVFESATEPTPATHGHYYRRVIGPFKTYEGAFVMVEAGPRLAGVADAERIATRLRKRGQTVNAENVNRELRAH